MPGFVAEYILAAGGNFWNRLATVIGFTGSLVGFMVVGGQFFYNFAGPVLGGPEWLYCYLYLFAGSALTFFGINLVSRIGAYGLLLFSGIMALLAVKGLPLLQWSNLAVRTGSISDVFLPYGPILFSLWASSSIPEVEEMLGRAGRKDLLKRVIAAAEGIALAVYIVFVVFIVGSMGAATTKSALVGLDDVFGGSVSTWLFFLGFIISFCSFIIMSLTLKKVLAYDFKINKRLAWLFATFVPAGLYALGFNNFISISSLVGGVFLGIDGLLIVLMFQKIHPQRKIFTYPLLAVFAAGIFYEIFYFLINHNAG